jgi:hypothetical protein
MGKSRKSDNHGDNEYRYKDYSKKNSNRNKWVKNATDDRRNKDVRSQAWDSIVKESY